MGWGSWGRVRLLSGVGIKELSPESSKAARFIESESNSFKGETMSGGLLCGFGAAVGKNLAFFAGGAGRFADLTDSQMSYHLFLTKPAPVHNSL